jgi:hypothetical protein
MRCRLRAVDGGAAKSRPSRSYRAVHNTAKSAETFAGHLARRSAESTDEKSLGFDKDAAAHGYERVRASERHTR